MRSSNWGLRSWMFLFLTFAISTPMAIGQTTEPLNEVDSASSGTVSSGTVVTEGIQATGWLDWYTATTLAAVCAVLALLWLWRQRELLGVPTTVFLSLLRIVVIALVFWMVAQPTWTRTETTSRRAEVVVLADNSGSMDTVDSAESAVTGDWQLAIENPDDPLALVDRVELDLLISRRRSDASVDLVQRAAEQIESIRGVDARLVDACLASIHSAALASEQWQEADQQAEKMALLASRTDAIDTALTQLGTLRNQLWSNQQSSSGSNLSSERTRKQYVASLLERFESQLNELSDGAVSVRRAVFDEQVTPIDSPWEEGLVDGNSKLPSKTSNRQEDANGGQMPSTDIAGALSFVRKLDPSVRLAAVLMLSEGQHNAGGKQDPVDVASTLVGTPVFTVGIGDRLRQRDLAIHRVNAPAMVFQEDSAVIEAVISSFDCEGDEVDVVLSSGNQVIETKTIRFPSKLSDVAVRFELPRTGLGRKEYSLEVEALDDELSLQNNHSVASIHTIKSKLYVLIADQQPRWEYRYLEQLFRRDKRVKLDKLLLMPKLSTTLNAQQENGVTSILPTTIDGWSKFDVVILGDMPPQVLTPEVTGAMRRWIQSGGNLIVVAGERSMPAAYTASPWFDVLPVTSKQQVVSTFQRPRPTPEGLIHPAIHLDETTPQSESLWRRAMSGPIPGYVSPFHVAKPTATVLSSLSEFAEGPTQGSSERASWLCVHRVGSGQVAYLSSPVSYRLRIRSGDKFHHRFWGQLVRWMTTAELSSGNRLVEIRTDRATYDEGQKPGIRVRLSDAAGNPVRGGDVQVELTIEAGDDSEQSTRQIELVEDKRTAGVYQTTLETLDAGVYRVRATGPTVQTLVQTTNQTQKNAATSENLPGDGVDQAVKNDGVVFVVESSGDLERLMTEANPVLLQQIAEASGGLSISPAALEEVLHVVSLAPDVSETQQRTPLWNRWSNLWLMIGCLSFDWWIRRRKGLV